MPKLPRISSKKTVQTLEKFGFIQTRQKGSHLILKKEIITKEGEIIEVGCVVPMQRKMLAVGTLKNILNQAEISVEEVCAKFIIHIVLIFILNFSSHNH